MDHRIRRIEIIQYFVRLKTFIRQAHGVFIKLGEIRNCKAEWR